jgi:hypothetical protein
VDIKQIEERKISEILFFSLRSASELVREGDAVKEKEK